MKLKKKVFKFCLHLNDAWNFSYEKKFSAFFYFLLREKLGYSLRQFTTNWDSISFSRCGGWSNVTF